MYTGFVIVPLMRGMQESVMAFVCFALRIMLSENR